MKKKSAITVLIVLLIIAFEIAVAVGILSLIGTLIGPEMLAKCIYVFAVIQVAGMVQIVLAALVRSDMRREK